MASPIIRQPQPLASASLASGREVLCVEDDPRVRNMLAQALKEMGFPATFAASAVREAGAHCIH